MMMMNVQDERKKSSASQNRNQNLMELMDSSDGSNLNRSSNSHATTYSANDHTNTGTNDTKNKITAGQQETQAVQVLRVLVLLLLLGAAIAVSLLMFLYMKGDEEDAFQQDYLDLANRLVLGFHAHAKLRLQTMDGLATTIATLAQTQDQTWPFVTIPHFEALATAARFVVGGAVTLGVYPYVTNETRKEWEAYTTTHTAWLNESYLYQQEFNEFFGRTISDKAPLYPLDSMGSDNTTTATAALSATGTRISVFDGPDGITPEIYRYGTEEEDALFVVDDSPGPYYVMWQVSPARASAAIDVNYNYNDPFYAGGYADAFDVVRETQSAIFAQAWNVDDAGYIDENDDFDFRVVPVAAMLYPVFDAIGNFDNRSVVAVIDLDVEFGPLFSSVLPSGSSPLLCVIHNPCGDQEFSYTVTGDKAFYLGAEDMHDGNYDDMVVETLLTDFYQTTQIMEGDSDSNANGNADYNGAEVNKDYCPWTLEVYPTKVMEEAYLTDKPIYYMLAILGAFLFTSTIFILYDRIVESRQRKVMHTATKSHVIVSSLFPEAVQEQLYGQHDQLQHPKAKSAKSNSAHCNIVGQDDDNDDDDEGLFLGKSSRHTRTSAITADAVLASPPIAELYKECTVFFADVAGFTKWSSTRSPTDVFTLLETIYGAFDKLARKMSIFKIETIGDCYVAVTGLPVAQPDHAVRMVRFARECLRKMVKLTRQLSKTLGDDTAALNIRVGLNSGPVTAGVLRGDKARFQLFGDTVNTGARIETCGEIGRIHASQETANQLVASGRRQWLEQRIEKVTAKGKGELQTFWIHTSTTLSVPSIGSTNKSCSFSNDSDNGDHHHHDDKDTKESLSDDEPQELEDRKMNVHCRRIPMTEVEV